MPRVEVEVEVEVEVANLISVSAHVARYCMGFGAWYTGRGRPWVRMPEVASDQ